MPVTSRALGAAVATAALICLGAGPASAAAPAGCDVAGAALTWGFKESFRSYIDGSIANGGWTTSGDVGYETPAFTWTGGEGWIAAGEGEIAFSGSVRFTGHGGVLDVTISDPVLRFDADGGVLLLTVTGENMDGDAIRADAAEFVALSDLGWGGADALVQLGAETTLTDAGAAAFTNYPPGEAFDPIAADLPVGDSCEGAAPAAEPGDADGPGEPIVPGWGPTLAGAVAGGAALAALIVVIAVAVRRSRRG